MKSLLRRIAVVLVTLAIASCAADRIHKDGLASFDRGDYEEGIAKLEQATKDDPGNLSFRLDLRARREAAVQQLIATADGARASGKADLAEATYRRVLTLEPENDRARRGLAGVQGDRAHAVRITKAEQLLATKQVEAAEAEVRAVLAEDPGFAPATALAARIDLAKGPTAAVPHLRTKDNRPVSLQFRDAPTKMVFEVLARQTGLNFIFDKDVKSDGKTTIFVNQASVDQAIDLILTQNQLARQVLSENMVFVYPNTPAKQKDYQDEIVHTFYLANAAPKDAESMLKTVLGSKTLFVDERSNVITIRDTPEHVRMAEKLIASLDVAEPEVIMEVEVLEITRSLADQLGINYPSNIAFKMNPLGAASTTTDTGTGTTPTVTAGTGLFLSDLHKQNSGTISVSSLGVSVDLLKTVGQTNVLSSPRIRARNKEKAKVLIGNRLPVVTSGSSATAGGTYSTSNVQYIEVGLTLEVQPTIHTDGNVAIKVALEVSSILKEVDVPIGNGGNTIAYQIGTRNVNTLLELKDGETQVLAGLIQDSDQRNSTHIPGLGDLPILGRLFGSTGTNRDKNEIVLSITPHIIRAQGRPTSETTEFWYGSESQTRTAPFASTPGGDNAAAAGPAMPGGVSYATGGVSTNSAPAASSGPRAVPARIDATAGAPPAPAATPPAPDAGAAGTTGAATTPATAPAAPAAAEAPPAVAKSAATDAKPSVTIDGPDSAKEGDDVNVAVRLASGAPLGRVRAQVRFDASALQLVSAEAGDLAPSGDTPKVELRPGGVQLELSGTPEAPVGGSGSVVNMRFHVVSAHSLATLIATQIVLVGEDGAAVGATNPTPLKIALTK